MPRNPIRDQKTVLHFINQIKRHTCLWDQTDVNYRNVNAKKEAWLSVARKIGQNVAVLRRKWRSLTCHYFKLRTALKLGWKPTIKDNPCPAPTWFAYSAMEFLGNSRNVRRERGKQTIKYIILGEENSAASEECEMNEMVQLVDEVEETEDNYETTMEDNLAEATSEYSVSYETANGKLEEDTSAILYHEQTNVDNGLDDDGISFKQRYMNEKRKSILLYELNEKLEKDLQQHKAEMQLQKMKIESLEQKLNFSEQKIAKLTNLPQENYNTIVSDGAEHIKGTLVNGSAFRKTKILTINSLPSNDVAGQGDPLYNPTGVSVSENNSEPFQFMTSSIKKMQSAIENFTNQSDRRYSGFGDFMVRELNERDEQTSIRLINEITLILKKEGNDDRNTKGNAK